jgi:hypothetical protein
MNVFVTVALADPHKQLEPHYSDIGRPSIDLDHLVSASEQSRRDGQAPTP